MARKETAAEALMKDYDRVCRFDGFLVSSRDKLWVVSRPKVDKIKWGEVLEILDREFLPIDQLTNALHARERVEVNEKLLAKTHYHQKRLSVPTLKKLCRDGVAPARALRGKDWESRIERVTGIYERARAAFSDGIFSGAWIFDRSEFGGTDIDYKVRMLEVMSGRSLLHLMPGLFPSEVDPDHIWDLLWKVRGGQPDHGLSVEMVERFLRQLGYDPTEHTTLIRKSIRKGELKDLVNENSIRKTLRKESRLKDLLAEIVKTQNAADTRRSPQRTARLLRCLVEMDPPPSTELLLLLTDEELKTCSSLTSGTQLTEAWSFFEGTDLLFADCVKLCRRDLSHEGKKEALELPRHILKTLDDDALNRYIDFSSGHDFSPEMHRVLSEFFTDRNPHFQVAAALIAQSDIAGDESWLLAFSKSLLSSRFPEIAQAIDDWRKPSVDAMPLNSDAVAQLLILGDDELQTYLGYRKMLGFGATFSDAVIAPMILAEKESQQIAHLEPRRGDPKIDAVLKRLTDPDAKAARYLESLGLARKAFDRGIVKMKSDALISAYETAAAAILNKKFGLADVPITRSVIGAFHLFSSEEVEPQTLEVLFRTALHNEPFDALPKNAAFLENATFDADKWVRGFDEMTDDGIRFYTETDPFEALRMGDHFDTCLSLAEGVNSASALSNALDINKHVVYLKSKNGAVVGRKLIAINGSGELLGYKFYCQPDYHHVVGAVLKRIEQFANDVGVKQVMRGEPATLESTWWYDDGAVDWSASAGTDARTNVDWSDRYHRAAKEKDVDALWSIAASESAYEHWGCAQLDLEELGVESPGRSTGLVSAGNVAWMKGASLIQSFNHFTDELEPCEKTVVNFLEALLRNSGRGEFEFWSHPAPPVLSVAPVSLLIKVLRRYWTFADKSHPTESFELFSELWAKTLLIALIGKEVDSEVASLLKEKSLVLRGVALGVFAQIEAGPTAMRTIRKLVKKPESPKEFELAVLALSFSKAPSDRALVARAFAENVESSRFAFACARQGNTSDVREKWRPKSLPADRYGIAVAHLVEGLDLSSLRDEVISKGKRKPESFLGWACLRQSFSGISGVPKDIRQISEYDGSVEAWVEWNSELSHLAIPPIQGHRQQLFESIAGAGSDEHRFNAFLACARTGCIGNRVLDVLVHDRLFMTESQYERYRQLPTQYRMFDDTIRSQTRFGELGGRSFLRRVPGLRTGTKSETTALELFEQRFGDVPPSGFTELIELVLVTANHFKSEEIVVRWLQSLDVENPLTQSWFKEVSDNDWTDSQLFRLLDRCHSGWRSEKR